MQQTFKNETDLSNFPLMLSFGDEKEGLEAYFFIHSWRKYACSKMDRSHGTYGVSFAPFDTVTTFRTRLVPNLVNRAPNDDAEDEEL